MFHATVLHAAWPALESGTAHYELTEGCPQQVTSWPWRMPASDPRGYDVLGYRLDLEFLALPPTTPLMDAVCRITLRLLDDPPPELRFDLVDQWTITEVLRDGAVIDWVHAGDSLRVALPAVPTSGAEHLVTIAYTGSPPRHGPFGGGLLMRRRGATGPHDPDDLGPTVGNINQPYSSHSWFPCKDHPSDKALFELSVIAPDTLDVLATGRLMSMDELPGDRRRWTWATAYPVATYVVGLAISNYSSWYEQCGDVPLEYHVFAEHRTAAEAILEPTCAMMRWLEDILGPYPFQGEKYAQASFGWSGAMENQTVTMLGQTIMAMPTSTAQLYVVHELAHHWFGNSLTPSLWRDIWLNEGFARYFESLWIEHTQGPNAYRQYMAQLRSPTLFIGQGLLGDPDPVLPNFMVYNKGAWVLHMLRHELGDRVFFESLRAYAQDPDLVRANTDRTAMVAAFSRTSGRNLAPWFDPWLETDDVPEFAVRWNHTGANQTLVELLQLQAGPHFPMIIPLRVHAGSDIVDLRLSMPSWTAREIVTTASPIDSVTIDPDGRLLRRTLSTPSPMLQLATPRPNPAGDSIELIYWLEGADWITASVYNALGRRILHRCLGFQQATGPPGDGNPPHQWTWNGRDDAGRRAADGVYWLEIRSSRDRSARKAVLVR